MKTIENECVGCPRETGCIGFSCPYINVERFYCDECGQEGTLYHTDFGEICLDCLSKMFPIVEGSECYIQ